MECSTVHTYLKPIKHFPFCLCLSLGGMGSFSRRININLKPSFCGLFTLKEYKRPDGDGSILWNRYSIEILCGYEHPTLSIWYALKEALLSITKCTC